MVRVAGGAGRRAAPTDAEVSESATGRRLRVVSGDIYADWDAVYQDNVAWIYRLMFAKVGNRADAEDLTSEVFVAALRPLRVAAPVEQVRAYLKATARTVLASYWRQRMSRQITTIDDDLADPDDHDDTVSDAPARALAVLDELPENYRRILELRFLQGYSVKEAAAELGTSVTNAKVLQHRALRRAARVGEEDGR